jgi:hypothetical protein
MFPDARVLIVINKPGNQPLVFSSEQHGLSWPPAIEDYVYITIIFRVKG